MNHLEWCLKVDGLSILFSRRGTEGSVDPKSVVVCVVSNLVIV